MFIVDTKCIILSAEVLTQIKKNMHSMDEIFSYSPIFKDF